MIQWLMRSHDVEKLMTFCSNFSQHSSMITDVRHYICADMMTIMLWVVASICINDIYVH